MTLNEYAALQYSMILHPDLDEGGYAVSFPDLPGCLTCADTLEKAIENAEDAKRVWMEATLDDGRPIPLPNELNRYTGQIRVRLPRKLHRLIVEQSRREGVSMNQLILCAVASYIGCNAAVTK